MGPAKVARADLPDKIASLQMQLPVLDAAPPPLQEHAHRVLPSLPGSIANLRMMSLAAVSRKPRPTAAAVHVIQDWLDRNVSFPIL
jgi:hypothetical protein